MSVSLIWRKPFPLIWAHGGGLRTVSCPLGGLVRANKKQITREIFKVALPVARPDGHPVGGLLMKFTTHVSWSAFDMVQELSVPPVS
jgi:hypothetical protein